MTRILASLTMVVSLCVAASAGVAPGSISGYVKDSAGVAQMGAAVELAGNAGQHQVAFTDAHGFFRVDGLLAGSYNLRVSAPSFLPALREDVALAAGASKVLNITLNTLSKGTPRLRELNRSRKKDNNGKGTLPPPPIGPILCLKAGARTVG